MAVCNYTRDMKARSMEFVPIMTLESRMPRPAELGLIHIVHNHHNVLPQQSNGNLGEDVNEGAKCSVGQLADRCARKLTTC